MNLLSRFKNFVLSSMTNSFARTNYVWMANVIHNQVNGVEAYIKKAYQLNADVYSIISFIAGKVAITPFGLYEVKDQKALLKYKSLSSNHYSKDTEKLKTKALKQVEGNHRILNMLNKAPNDYMTASEFKYGSTVYRLATGNTYIRGFGPEAEPTKFVEMHLLPTQWTLSMGGGQYNAVRAYRMTWDAEEIPTWQVSHSKYFNPDFQFPSNPHMVGQSPLQAAANAVNRSNSGYEASTKAFQNGGMAGILYQDGGQDLTDPQRQDLQEHIDKKVSGAGNYKQILAASSKLGWLKIGESPVDLGVLDSLAADLRTLCNIFHLNSALFNDPENKTFNNISEARKAAITDAVLPELTAMRDQYNLWLVPGWEKADGKKYFIDYDASVFPELAASMKDLAEWLERAWWITPNEKREQMDYDKIEDPAFDEPFVPIGVTPLSAATPEDGQSDAEFQKAFNNLDYLD